MSYITPTAAGTGLGLQALPEYRCMRLAICRISFESPTDRNFLELCITYLIKMHEIGELRHFGQQ